MFSLLRPLSTALLLLLAAPLAEAAGGAPTVTVGKPYKVIDAEQKHYFSQGGNIVAVKIDGDRYTLQRMSADTLTEQSRMVYDDMPDGQTFEAIVELDGGHHLLYSLWDRKNGQEQLFARPIDAGTGTFSGEGTRILAVDGKVTGTLVNTGMYAFAVVGKFDVTLSADEKTMMVRYRKKPEVRDDSRSNDIIGVWVYGPGMQEKWHEELVMPYTEEKMDFWDEAVDSNGNAYILAKVREGAGDEERKREDGDQLPNYHAELLRVSPGTNEFVITTFSVGDKFISSAGLYESPGRGMVVAGAYNTGKKLSSADGLFTVSIGKSGELGAVSFHEIPLEILKQYESGRVARRAERKESAGNAELAALELRWMLVGDDGSITLIGEQHYVEVRRYMDSRGQWRTTYVYHYDDMLMARVNAKGTLDWMVRLPKTQVGGAQKGGMSFARFHGGGVQWLAYMDNLKNLELQPDAQPATHVDGQGGYLTTYRVEDKTGNVSRVSLFDTRDVQGIELFQVGVNRIVAVDDHTFVMEAYKKKKEDILVKVVLD